jgi:hypothetical protein
MELEITARSVTVNGFRFRMDRGVSLDDGSIVTLVGFSRRGGRVLVKAGQETLSLHRAHDVQAFEVEVAS